MYLRILANNVHKNRLITATTMLFITVASILVSVAAVLVCNLSGAIDNLVTQSKTPHFLQMHSGSLNYERLSLFVEHTDMVADYQVQEFLNLDGAQILFRSSDSEAVSLAKSVQDNGLAVQNDRFDLLLDLDGNIITVADGEIYVPLVYFQSGLAKIGEPLVVAGKKFLIAGVLRDSLMQPLLSSSKRFLVSRADFEELRSSGSIEYLIEFLLRDKSEIGSFGAAYVSSGLESNGPTLTFPLFRMLNGLSDGMMIAVLLLVSALVISIAFLCIRFTLLAKIEDDYREIGVMKAIGLCVSDIKKIYLIHYTAISAGGCLLGYGLSFFVTDRLMRNIRLYMGDNPDGAGGPLVALLGVALIFLVILVFVNSVLNRFHRISPAVAVRFGISRGQPGKRSRFLLSENTLFTKNIFMGIKDVLSRKGLYGTMLTVLILATFIMIVPRNLYTTLSSDSFITYMGVGKCDLRIDIQQTEDIAGKVKEIAAVIQNDSAIAKFVVMTTAPYRIRMADGSEQRLKIESGDHTVFPLVYVTGHAPLRDDEIALSIMNADELGKKVGDQIVLEGTGTDRVLHVCGIYSDITNGGKTAKAVFRDPSDDILWSVISVELDNPALIGEKVVEYAERYPFAKVSGIKAFIFQTYGATIQGIKKASLVATGIAICLALLITVLFMRMLVSKDRYESAVMKAFGFTSKDIIIQYLARALVLLSLGLGLGTILANTAGESLVGVGLSLFGAASFQFIIDPLHAYLVSPLLMACTVLVAVLIGTRTVRYIQISENIKEQ